MSEFVGQRSRVTSDSYKSDFFLQAEDGIRDAYVTGVQTCALPISTMTSLSFRVSSASRETSSIKSALVISHAPYRETNRLPTSTTDTLRFAARLASLSFRWTSVLS